MCYCRICNAANLIENIGACLLKPTEQVFYYGNYYVGREGMAISQNAFARLW